MNWQNTNNNSGEEKKIQFRFKDQDDTTMTTKIDELEEKKAIQLQKFQDPAANPERQSYLNLTSQFSDLLLNNKLDEMISTILTEDCEFFIFSSTGRTPVQYSLTPQGIHSLYKGVKVHKRIVAESYVDLEKKTAVQFCHYTNQYEDEDSPVNEIVAEIFTIRDYKISRYRTAVSRSTPAHGGKDPFELSRKDRILMKLKEINYAIAGQPDLEKVASFFTEDTQYKIWSWEAPKCAIFSKHDFAEGFQKLQENFEIKCCVPYEISVDTEHIFGTYVYHLEGKTGKFKDQKFVWLTTCVYTFNENLDLIRVNQQGELHTEGDVLIPFEVSSTQKITKVMRAVNGENRVSLDLFYNDIVHFACPLYRYAAEGLPNVGFFSGLNHLNKIQQIPQKGNGMEWRTPDEVLIDSNGSGYDVGIMITCAQGTFNFPEYKYNGLKLNSFNIARASLEKGTVVKGFLASCAIPEPIPSPFDNPNIEGVSILPRSSGV